MINILIMPIRNPIKAPNGPALGKNVVPGITNEPQPRLLPKARAKAPSGVRYLARLPELFFSISLFSSIIKTSLPYKLINKLHFVD